MSEYNIATLVIPAPEPGSSLFQRGRQGSWTPDQVRGDEHEFALEGSVG